ncbi:response regulator transcription factor [Azospirillum sp.]|uniref:response regulator transcription factor n=1 Tax=Azospirillum sp. TaxID=34012 RepID=UPI002D635A41|nr:response regulator [Azospirillum sp.]HYD68305.1 response regulator [Azospirillum sp.]
MVGAGERLVYIVDDDEPVRDSMKTLLEACDFDVRDFASCNGFLEAYKASPGGCLLLDLHMPAMSGLEFMERFGARLGGMPVIMVTGRGDEATLARARQAGVVAVLEKPFEEDDLLDTVERLLPAAANGN